MNKFFRAIWREKVSFFGVVLTFGFFVYDRFVPTSIPLPVSQSVFTSIAGGGLSVAPVISLSVLALVLLSIFLIFGVVRIWRRK